MMQLKDFKIGQKVFIRSFGYWYEGEVAKLGRSKAHVTYTTGSGVTRTKSYRPSEIELNHPDGKGR